MKIAKALGIGTAAAAGVGVTTYGAVKLLSKSDEEIKRNSLMHQAESGARKIEKAWEDKGFKALDSKSENWEWE